MEQQKGEILIITTLVIIIIVIFLISLFTVFQRRKNTLLQEREEAKKKYEQEIAETQIEIREETLRNISWELHDNIGQLLTLAKIQLQNATPDNINEISETISKSLSEIRSLSKLINPEFINKITLKEALHLEVERFNRLNYINAKLNVKGKEKQINQKHGIIIFRILQEFFSNTIKHAKASNLNVTLKFKKDNLEIIAQDDGIGFEMNKVVRNGIGIQNIKTRAELIKAEVNFESKPQQGTILKINYYI
ncbi:sensor histidine kinase [Tenacibaculum sp. IB213877]|uniref:sensor histidine kinase n=1 Tax=Tenacibaculum sp. IB213877 TaxID=3097351 RepID=UPI002A5A6F4C|nr:ATP-binding protein [Tenacibaculum sp. IB213877]MDY0780942.1 ATP-binding protein [Tenacibaculum sp. IB213877]